MLRFTALLFAVLPIAALSNPVSAQTAIDDDAAGPALFEATCGGCHGLGGEGDGPLAALLTVPVPDITTLAAENDGEFPMLDVIHVIDGRSGLRGHESAMPVFGNLYTMRQRLESEDFDAVIETRGRVLVIAEYLQSIQK